MKFDPATRVLGICVATAWLTLGIGCAEAETPKPPGPNEVRLELGGTHPTIRERLVARTATQRSPLATRGGSDSRPKQLTPPADPTDADPQKHPGPMDAGAGSGAGRFATLGQGQTLYGLAKEHLRDGARWREILTLNGLLESQLNELPAGAVLRLPVE